MIQSEADEKIAQLRASLMAEDEAGAAPKAMQADAASAADAGMALAQKPAAGFTVQAVQLAKRELQGLWRNKPGFVATFLVPTVLNLFFALIFFQVGMYSRRVAVEACRKLATTVAYFTSLSLDVVSRHVRDCT